MSRAPAVACTVRRSRIAGVSMLGLWLCGALLAMRSAVDAAGLAGSGWRLLIIGVALLGTGAFAAWQLRRTSQGLLRWDGEQWWWQPRGASARVGTAILQLDLQRLLLVRWSDRDDRRATWLWVDARAADHASAWHLLRCALLARPDALSRARVDKRRASAHAPVGTSS